MANFTGKRSMNVSDVSMNSFFGLNSQVKDKRALKKGLSPDAKNWLTSIEGDSISLRPGMLRLGSVDAGIGKVTGLGIGTRYDGLQVPFFTCGRKIKYYDATTSDIVEIGTDSLPTNASGEDVSIEPYQNIAGSFVYLSSPNSSIYKIPVANPASLVDLASTTYRGKITIDQNRMFLWDRHDSNGGSDVTAVYMSWIDRVILSDYTAITGEVVGVLGSTTYTGTLAFKAAGAKRTCMFVIIKEAGGEQLVDDRNGNLVGNQGSTGTINYATGAYSVTFNHTTTGAVTADYYWEDASDEGIADFSFATNPRVAATGNQYRQDSGGAKLQAVFPLSAVQYCFHELKTWALTLTADDTKATNLPYRTQVGIKYFRSAFPTADGILFIDNSNPSNPEVKRLMISANDSSLIEPVPISQALDLSQLDFDYAVAYRWENYDIICCQKRVAGVKLAYNTEMYVRNFKNGFWDRLEYRVSVLAQWQGALLAGDSLSNNLYVLFSGYDDDGEVIDNYWTSSDLDLDIDGLKKFNRMVVKGLIQKAQKLKVSVSYNGGAYTEIITIDGSASYVDIGKPTTVGNRTIGSMVIGGGGMTTAYPFTVDFGVFSPNFETVSVKVEALDIGYVQVNEFIFKDVRYKGRGSLPTRIVN